MDHPGTTQKPKLPGQLRQAVRARPYSIPTEEAYVQWAGRVILFHNKRHPLEMDAPKFNAYLTHLAAGRRVSASSQNQAVCAGLFLYELSLNKDSGRIEDPVSAKKAKKLPVALTRDEVAAVLRQTSRFHRTTGNLLYGYGLQPMECLLLRLKDNDFGYSQIVVRDGKGSKDRMRCCRAD